MIYNVLTDMFKKGIYFLFNTMSNWYYGNTFIHLHRQLSDHSMELKFLFVMTVFSVFSGILCFSL